MDENRQPLETSAEDTSSRSGTNRGLVIVAVLLLVGAGLALGYGYHQQSLANQMSAHDQQLNATVSQLQSQSDALTAKLNDMVAAQQAAEAAAQANANKASAKKPGVDKRYKQLQTQLEDQKKQLTETQDEVAKNRSDLEGNLSSTKDELNGSIAKTHEELVALAKRGERSYFEFNLAKSKQFSRVGPIMLSLRRSDTKHKNFDLAMMVDDNELSKKRVNLYEPIWIHREGDPQPVQVIINRVEKNNVQGYVSAPRYKNSELTPVLTSVSSPVSPTPATDTSTTPASPEKPPQQ
jgi:flagellar motility protein MotE (MotC chaperone)